MKATLTIILDRKGRAKGTDREAPLDVRVIKGRKVLYVGTGIKVRHSEWVAGRVVNRLDASTLNDRLAIIYRKVGDEVNAATDEGRNIDADEIRNRVFQVKEEYSDSDTLLDWIVEQVKMLNVKEGTRKHYGALVNRLDEYGRLRKWRDVTVEGICLFDGWLHSLRGPARGGCDKNATKKAKIKGEEPREAVAYGRLGNGLSDAAIYNYHKCLKALLNRAELYGKIQRNPYGLLKGRFKRGERENVEYLTEEEMRRICQLELPEGSLLERSKDLFVFQMFTGLAYSDTQVFSMKNYKKMLEKDAVTGEKTERWVFVGQRIKTGVAYVSQLLPPAVRVAEHYGGCAPHIDNADYNHQLKAIGVMAKIETRLHSHLARHTFATMMLRNGAKIENVSKMLGHTNITQTQRYAKTLAQSVYEDYELVREKWK